ncbi:hypothetical protein [Anaerovibrio sp. RM50]|uniref:hypothetical protein n=1 Tax=Anaerovibrio sp. RM50 TaxID=1200557 RepID=UPI000483DC04|nr:hypothetical protein [Anaerovibrio sp. RM50]
MDEALRKDYEDWVNKVQKELETNKDEWVERYGEYAKKMVANSAIFSEAKGQFNKIKPLYVYLTIGKVKDKELKFDLRYLGQSVGTIKVKDNIPKLSVDEKKNNSSIYFGYDLGAIKDEDWSKGPNAKKFRDYYINHATGAPRQEEHMVESALFSELEKTTSVNKTLCGIQPVSFENTRIHMKTALKASAAKHDDVEQSKTGGEVDILCRRKIGNKSRLVVIEVKDENIKKESFDAAMKQAISYAVFISELIHSDAGKDWMKIWGMENQIKEKYVIDCVVAMPKGDTEPSYAGEQIEIPGTGDKLELHYMILQSDLEEMKSGTVKFEHSFGIKNK